MCVNIVMRAKGKRARDEDACMIHTSPLAYIFNAFSSMIRVLGNGTRVPFGVPSASWRQLLLSDGSREKQCVDEDGDGTVDDARCETREPRGPVKQEGTDYPSIIGCPQITSSLILQSHLHLVCSSSGTIRRPL